MRSLLVLVRHDLRRDRWMILWWCVGGALLYWSQAYGVVGAYTSQAQFSRMAVAVEDNAAFIAMLGPARALDTVGGQVAWQATAFGAIVAGLMSMFIVGRHTRAEEESGRDELVRSLEVTRRAPLTAALLVALLANVVLGAVVSAALIAYRPADPVLAGLPLPVTDSVATGVGVTLVGWVFSATALVAAQLTQSTRGMYGIAGVVIGASYGLRAVGDVGNHALSWIGPIGWYQAMHPYSGLRWWPVLLMLAAALVATVAAYVVFERRDFASGVLADRPGPADAGAGLRSGIGLAWRLQRGAVVGWTVGLVFTGLAYGSIGDSVKELLGNSDFARAMGAGVTDNLVDGFYATANVMIALVACGFAISSALRPRAEEESGHAEALIATGLSRGTWLAGHVLVTVAGTAVVLLAGGFAMGAAYAATTGDGGAVLRLGPPVLAYVAPVLVLSGVARLLFGLAPRLLVVAWLPLVFATAVLVFGDILRIPQWVRDISPFQHVPLVPAQDFALLPVAVIAAVAAALSIAGQFAFRQRDIG